MAYRGRNHESFTYVLPPGGDAGEGSVWGDGVYSDDSSVGLAAVHAGLITLKDGGRVTFTIRPGRASYPAATRHGIRSSRRGEWPGSFQFLRSVGDAWRPPAGAGRWEAGASTPGAGRPPRTNHASTGGKPPEKEGDGNSGWWFALAAAVVTLLLYANHPGFAAWAGQLVNDGTSDIEVGDCLADVGESAASSYVEVPCAAANSRYSVLDVRPGEALLESDPTSVSGFRVPCEDVAGNDAVVRVDGSTLCVESV
ncbi:LCCL domain-containing protein [Nocardiopsis sp. CT-R113]|uniref:LCCL domain-containing protein n=1 Tax=Nocardiopsis codii TaxID=3065942 RepID=A0ABU7KGK9_9ACTN|nr:LCCL domain-containing protein [Nocardiopsis sp. CT-R113]MEE2041364.1 LCCL domain-containing protein [Nocardiopsis sp. CT-R113]